MKATLQEKSESYAMAIVAMVKAFSGFHGDLIERKAMDSRGQLGLRTVLAALVVVIAASLAVIVVDQFDQSLGDPSSSSLSTAQNDVLSGFSDMTSLIGPLLLVAIAVVIIGLIRRVQSS